MPQLETITAQEALSRLLQEEIITLDVRSEGEFSNGQFLKSTNIPILNNENRKIIGTTYKNSGRENATSIGHKLVEPHKESLVQAWKTTVRDKSFLYCWRGGLRSQITQEWLCEAGVSIPRVLGGYKAMRQKALQQIDSNYSITILSGYTGSNKTTIIEDLDCAINLEKLANHRGSSFGYKVNSPQPSQTTFENNLSLELLRLHHKPFTLEDESHLIGRRSIPNPLYDQMCEAPCVFIETPPTQRAQNIYRLYIERELNQGIEAETLKAHHTQALQRIQRKLGGLLYSEILKKMSEAYEHSDADLHIVWIEKILKNYYDKMYLFAFNKKNRRILFRGSFDECHKFLERHST